MAKEKIQFEVNGQQVLLEVDPDELLIDVLRDRLGLKGTKTGCRAGECGRLLRHPEWKSGDFMFNSSDERLMGARLQP